MKIISIVNHKGGVGKSNTSINLAAALATFSYSVLLIDMDPQGNASRGFGFDTSLVKNTIFDVMFLDININRAIKPTCIKNLDIIPSKLRVTNKDKKPRNRHVLLKKSLQNLKKSYDYIIVDCPPSLEFLTVNAMVASNSIVIPVQCEYFAMNAVTQVLAKIANVQTRYNKKLEIEGVLLTMYDSKNEVDNSVAEEIRSLFKEKTFSTQIPRTPSVPESNMKGIPVISYRPTSSASTAYFSFAKEIAK